MLTIPVIDLFAGPGGLGEGFSAFTPRPRAGSVSARSLPGFRIALSIEKDPSAWQTLRLRSFFRQFSSNAAESDIHLQPNSESAQTGRAGRQFELGGAGSDHRDLSRRIDEGRPGFTGSVGADRRPAVPGVFGGGAFAEQGEGRLPDRDGPPFVAV